MHSPGDSGASAQVLRLLSSRLFGRKAGVRMTAQWVPGMMSGSSFHLRTSGNFNLGPNVVELRTPCVCASPWRHAYPGPLSGTRDISRPKNNRLGPTFYRLLVHFSVEENKTC